MEKSQKKTAVDVYMSAVFKWGILLETSAAVSASVIYLAMKLMGLYPTVPWPFLLVFILFDISQFIYGQYLIRTSLKGDYVTAQGLRRGKIFLSTVIMIQWNMILYMIPSRTFFCFIFFFIVLISFFLDIRVCLVNGAVCLVSYYISFFFRADVAMPVRDGQFIPDLAVQAIGICFGLAGLFALMSYVNQFLVTAKKDELEQNNARVESVLGKAREITRQLSDSSKVLSETAQNQSSAAEELSAISETLAKSSEEILENTKDSQGNLSELVDSNTHMSLEIEKVNSLSNQLLEASQTNEGQIKALIDISATVEASTHDTKSVMDQLKENVDQIGTTLDLITQIASSINLLALNASIEAARAGDAGRGFAVVATEVGSLATSTRESLQEVNDVIMNIHQGTENMAGHIDQNMDNLHSQNETTRQTIDSTQVMLGLLSQSAQAVQEVGQLQQKQNQVIETTISMNELIANNVTEQNQQFQSIADLATSNAQENQTLADEVDRLNDLAQELNALLDA